MNESCGNCRHFTKFYVPPLRSYKEQSNGYCCTCFKEQVMWLGSNEELAKNGMCEMWSEREVNADGDSN